MGSYLLFSHDGYGLGHVRRNVLIARAILDADPHAVVRVATGIAVSTAWLDDPRIEVLRLPPLVKADDGSYRNAGMSFEAAVRRRAELLAAAVDAADPDVIVVDRHPYGTGGELLAPLRAARRRGTRTVLGLRDVLDEASAVIAELHGRGWDHVDEMFDEVLVYGGRVVCDHVAEYGLPVEPSYVGWVTEDAPVATVDDKLLVVAAGGGGDGEKVYRLGVELLQARRDWRGIVVAGPYASPHRTSRAEQRLGDRLAVGTEPAGCIGLYAQAGAVVQMAGYNSTVESLAAGVRPVLVPRRSPRREQAIRASRLAALGLADVVDDAAGADEVGWLLDRPRRLGRGDLERAGLHLDGAARAADRILALGCARVA
jgi:predicted glycosyltransferase